MAIEIVEVDEAVKNIRKQGSKVLRDIANAYSQGMLDEPATSYMFCSLLACICEGKVEGSFDAEKKKIQWALTEKYHAALLEDQERIVEETEKLDNVVRGPWK